MSFCSHNPLSFSCDSSRIQLSLFAQENKYLSYPGILYCQYLQSFTKLLRHFTKFPLIQGAITHVFIPIPPFQRCQCCYVVKTKSGELQTPGNNIERGERGIKYSLRSCKSRHSRKMCDIRLSQLLLSMIVGNYCMNSAVSASTLLT